MLPLTSAAWVLMGTPLGWVIITPPVVAEAVLSHGYKVRQTAIASQEVTAVVVAVPLVTTQHRLPLVVWVHPVLEITAATAVTQVPEAAVALAVQEQMEASTQEALAVQEQPTRLREVL